MRWGQIKIPALLSFCVLTLCGCSSGSYESRPFFQKEVATETHGKKTLFDRIIETDPGSLDVELASDYAQRPPAVIAVMPFTDRGSAQYTVDKIPLTFRDEEERDQWAWTDAQRLRRAFVAYLSEREFIVLNPIAIDAVLEAHGIDNDEKLQNVSLLTLGKWFHCDAVVFGTVDHYEAIYLALIAGFQVGVSARMVSTHDGETLMRSSGSRYSISLMPAITPEDILINSAENLLDLRDVELARAEEEVARELVIRIPVSQKLRIEMARNAIQSATEAEDSAIETMPNDAAPAAANASPAETATAAIPAPSANETQFLDAIAIGDDRGNDDGD
jgi:hypothetical protein